MRTWSVFWLLVLVCILCVSGRPTPPKLQPKDHNQRPIIGVLDQPTIETKNCRLRSYGDKYLAAAYVKLIESTGARVAHIPYDASREELTRLFYSVNGLLLPGGDANYTPGFAFFDGAHHLVQLAMEANRQGTYFPVLGICQGMEMLTVMLAGSNCCAIAHDAYDAENLSLPLEFTPAADSSMLWGEAPLWVKQSVTQRNLTFNNHDDGMPPEKLSEFPSLQKLITVLSTNEDRQGKAFVSSWEGVDLPFWGLQFHPSKNAYEWNEGQDLNHSVLAVSVMQWVGSFIYSQARYNHHQFESSTAQANALIYATPPMYTYDDCNGFTQCYFWNHTSTPSASL